MQLTYLVANPIYERLYSNIWYEIKQEVHDSLYFDILKAKATDFAEKLSISNFKAMDLFQHSKIRTH